MIPIVSIQLERLNELLKEQEMEMEVSESALTLLAQAGFDPEYGARPLKRQIQNSLQDPLAELVIEATLKPGHKVLVDVENESLQIEVVDNPDSQFTAMPTTITPLGMELNPSTEPIEDATKDEISTENKV